MNDSRDLLIVSYHALPAVTPGSLRVAWTAGGLAHRGWRVTVLTAEPTPTSLDGVSVITTRGGGEPPAFLRGRFRTLWNDYAVPDRYVRWNAVVAPHLRDYLSAHPHATVLSTSPPHSTHLAIAAVRRSHRFRWYADFRDPWTAPQRYPRFATAWHRRQEARVLAVCDGVIANTPGNRVALLDAFSIQPDRVHVVENAFDDAMLEAATPVPDDSADLTFFGEVYPGMTNDLVMAMGRIHARDPARVPHVAIVGDVDPRERARIAGAGLNAFFEERGRVPYAESLRAMKRARALLVLLPARASWRTCVPSKVYPYLASGRPVLAIGPEGDTARVLRETGAGVALVPTGDADALAAGLLAFVSGQTHPDRRADAIRRYAASSRVDALETVIAGGA
jgi:glycosyltransferase involved in cell wall biosynthesis